MWNVWTCYNTFAAFIPLLYCLIWYRFIVSAGRSPLTNIHHWKCRREGEPLLCLGRCYISWHLLHRVPWDPWHLYQLPRHNRVASDISWHLFCTTFALHYGSGSGNRHFGSLKSRKILHAHLWSENVHSFCKWCKTTNILERKKLNWGSNKVEICNNKNPK